MYNFFLGFVLSLIPFTLSAQQFISGRITDAGDGKPIPGAAVFIANTTVGTTTDSAGYYRLRFPGEGSYSVVISHVAYESVFREIEPRNMSLLFHAAMHTREMEDITVTAKVRSRNKDIDLFWKTILGKAPSKKTLQPLNPEAVFYYFNPETEKLTITCHVPLQIINHETGYQIQYVLNYFTHDYNVDISDWEGQYMFIELAPATLKQKNLWETNRKKIYQVSITNFIKSLYHDSLLANGFLLACTQKQEIPKPDYTKSTSTTVISYYDHHTNRYYSRPVDFSQKFDLTDAKIFSSIDSVIGDKIFVIPSNLDVMLVCFGKPVTEKNVERAKWQKPWEKTGLFRNIIFTPGEPVRIFSDGSYKNPIRFTPVFDSKTLSGLNMILPIDYHPDGNLQVATMGETEQLLPEQLLADSLTSIAQHFDEQLAVFPQEKLHLHTDKPYYLSGERIWFRAHVVDAASHIPSFSSGSVFVELFDARDSVVSRVKTGSANDLFSGHIPIPEDVPEGDYAIRAYTAGMRNLDEDYFFMKNIRIGDPMSRMMHALPEFEFLPDHKIGASIRFSRIRPLASITPESANISINGGKPMNLKFKDGISGFSFDLQPNEKQRVMLLDAKYENNPYRQCIKIPLPDDDFDVSFYPEGGSILADCTGRIAFKAMQRDGTEIDVSGMVYDQRGNEVLQFKTDLRGMGIITMQPEQGDRYYAVCTNDKGQSKRFDLPVAVETGYSLSANWSKDRLIVQVRQPGYQPSADTLCLLVHTRGVVQDVRILENTNDPVVFRKDFFPSGVSHLLLLSKDMVPVSERLVFAYNDDQAKVTCKSDKDTYPSRSPVEYAVNITDEAGAPLHGNFSVSVTDDHEVAADTTSSILTSLLLTSDVRGHIPDPGYYFRKKDQSSVYALDLLMLTQGWRRYDTERMVRNEFMYPDTLLGKGYDISGTVRIPLTQKPVEKANVSILSFSGDFVQEFITDHNGRFYLQDGGVADSTRLVVQTAPKLGRQNLELTIDKPSYPERTVPVVTTGTPDREVFAKYADKAEQQYIDEHGTRIVHIEEVTITAQRKKAVDYSFFYKAKDAHYSVTEEELDKFPAVTMSSLLERIPGVNTSKNYDERTQSYLTHVFYRRYKVMFIVDGIKESAEYVTERIIPSDVAQIDLLTESVAMVLGATIDEPNVISIHTKRGKSNTPQKTPYIKSVMPLGFQKPAEFYAPKYDTPSQNTKPDLRTTIHWQPNITTDENGKATFNFYTADIPSIYTVVIEGMTTDGKIVYHKDQISVVSSNQ